MSKMYSRNDEGKIVYLEHEIDYDEQSISTYEVDVDTGEAEYCGTLVSDFKRSDAEFRDSVKHYISKIDEMRKPYEVILS